MGPPQGLLHGERVSRGSAAGPRVSQPLSHQPMAAASKGIAHGFSSVSCPPMGRNPTRLCMECVGASVMGQYISGSLQTPCGVPMDSKVSAMELGPSAIGAPPNSDAVLQTAVAGVQTDSKTIRLKPWNEVHSLFKRVGNGASKLKDRHGEIETSDQEEVRLLKQGVDGISKQLYLGKNVDGSVMYLPPMLPAEKLLRVDLTNHKSMKTLLDAVAKLIAQKPLTGKRDICGVKCWLHSDGRARPQLKSAPKRTALFCDNMCVWACEMSHVLQLFRCFDLCDRVVQGGDATQRFGVGGCCKASLHRETVGWLSEEGDGLLVRRMKENHQYKVMLCSVPLSVITTIHRVLEFARTLSLEVLNSEERFNAETVDFRVKNWQSHHPKNLYLAAQYAARVKWIDTDIGRDWGGQLHPPRVKAVILENGGSCVPHQCGSNMIRQAPVITGSAGSQMTSQMKFYDKVHETISSSRARSDAIGQKIHYLLNPSTSSLRDTFRAFHAVGVSRSESTHSCDSDRVPELEEMISVHESLSHPFEAEWGKTLVKCSIQAHLELVDAVVDSTCAVYLPHLGCLKSASLKQGGIGSRVANKQAEGVCIHYLDTKTKKFIGNYVHSRLGRYGGAVTEGWQQLCLNLAWGSLCGQPPVVAICVAGPGMCLRDGSICEDDGFDVKRSLYFRTMVATEVVVGAGPPEPRTMLLAGATGLYSGVESLRFAETDLNLIGVDLSCLRNLRIEVMDKTFEPTFINMGGRTIELRPLSGDPTPAPAVSTVLELTASVSDVEEGGSTCSSETRWRVASAERRTYPVSLLPRSKVLVSKVSVETGAGRVRKGEKKGRRSVYLLAGGDHYQVPEYALKELLDRFTEDEARGVVRRLYVWRNEDDRFRWEFAVDPFDPIYSDNAQINKASSIPAQEWHEVLDFGEKPHARGGKQMFVRIQKQGREDSGKFFMPVTVKELLLDHVRRRGISLSDLKGWRLIRTAEGLVKTVPSSKNNEPPIVLLDGNGISISNHPSSSDAANPDSKRKLGEGSVIASNIDDGRKRQRR